MFGERDFFWFRLYRKLKKLLIQFDMYLVGGFNPSGNLKNIYNLNLYRFP